MPTAPAKKSSRKALPVRSSALTRASDPSYIESMTKRLDGWQNVMTGFGTQRDARESTKFCGSIVDYTKTELDAMYCTDDVIGRVVDLIPEEMTREGFSINEDDKGVLFDTLEAMQFHTYVRKALRDARLYGTSILVLGADDGRRLRSPLIESKVKSFDWLAVLNRFDLRVARYYSDPASKKYGQPEIYEVAYYDTINQGEEDANDSLGYGAKIHESRVIRFDGTDTPDEVIQDLQGWSLSVLNRLYEPIRDFQQICQALAVIPTNFSQAFIKIKGLAGLLASDTDNLVTKRLALIDMTRSVFNMIPLDAENEEFGRSTMSMTGVTEVFSSFANKLSLATGIPKSLLIGESPGGLNGAGDSDHRFFYNKVKSLQNNILRAPVTRAINMIAKAKGIKPANDAGMFTVTFRALWTPSSKEEAEERNITAKTDVLMIDAKVVTAKEVATSRYHNGYSSEMILDTEQRKLNDGKDAQLATNGQPIDIEKVSGIVQQVASGAIPTQAGKNILTVLYQVPEDLVEKLLKGVVPIVPVAPGAPTGSTTDKPNAQPRSNERGPAAE